MNSNCETCGGLAALITEGPFEGDRHTLRYCAYCSQDLCDSCLAEAICHETPDGDDRHKIEADCPACGGTQKTCQLCDGDGVVLVFIEDVLAEEKKENEQAENGSGRGS
jgi:hypothetical protein